MPSRTSMFVTREKQILRLQERIESLRWEEARLICEEFEAGTSLESISREIGKSRSHVIVMRNCWRHREGLEPGQSFNRFYNSALVRRRRE